MNKKNNFQHGGGHPLIYHPFILKFIPEDLSGKRILDLGCGKGILGYLLRATRNASDATLIGVEGNPDTINFVKEFNIYNRVLKRFLPNINLGKEEFDYILCSEVIEHLTKKAGNDLLDKIDGMCKEQAIITTPNVLFQPAGENKLDRHISLWSVDDFKKRGYKVYGLGIKLPPPTEDSNVLLSQLFYGLEYLLTPFAWLSPRIGGYLLAVKNFK